MPEIFFNGKPLQVPGGVTLENILKQQGRDPALVVVTVNGKFIPRPEYAGCVPEGGATVLARELLDGG